MVYGNAQHIHTPLSLTPLPSILTKTCLSHHMTISRSPESSRLLSISARLKVVGRIRPAVSCCLSSDLATERDQILWPLSILGLRQSPGKQGMRGPHPISMFATSRHVRSGLTRSSSLPTKVTGRSANTEPRAATECAWTELKREMGSLKADNRMVPHGANGTRRGKRMVAHRRRAFPLLPIIPLEATQGSNDPANTIATGNVQSKTFASPALDRRDRPRDAAAPKTHLSGKVDSKKNTLMCPVVDTIVPPFVAPPPMYATICHRLVSRPFTCDSFVIHL